MLEPGDNDVQSSGLMQTPSVFTNAYSRPVSGDYYQHNLYSDCQSEYLPNHECARLPGTMSDSSRFSESHKIHTHQFSGSEIPFQTSVPPSLRLHPMIPIQPLEGTVSTMNHSLYFNSMQTIL